MLYELAALAPGQPAPALIGRTLAGAEISLDRLRGRVVLMAVWASW